jgi:hypothetical protein
MLPQGKKIQPNIKLTGLTPAWLERARQAQAARDEKQAEAERQRVEKAHADFREWQGERTLELFALLNLLGIPAKFHDHADAGDARVYTHKPTDEQVNRHTSDYPHPYAVIGNIRIVAFTAIWDTRPPSGNTKTEEYQAALKAWRDTRKLDTASFKLTYEPTDPEQWQAVCDYQRQVNEEALDTFISLDVKQEINRAMPSTSFKRGEDLLAAFADAIDAINGHAQTLQDAYDNRPSIVEGDTIPTPEELAATEAQMEAQHQALEDALRAIAPDIDDASWITLVGDAKTQEGIEMPLAVVYILDALESMGWELREVSDDQ